MRSLEDVFEVGEKRGDTAIIGARRSLEEITS
jgi:hypothetical protein